MKKANMYEEKGCHKSITDRVKWFQKRFQDTMKTDVLKQEEEIIDFSIE